MGTEFKSTTNFFTERKLTGIEPSKVTRCGLFGLSKRYEYNIPTGTLLRKVLRDNPDLTVQRAAGIVGGNA